MKRVIFGFITAFVMVFALCACGVFSDKKPLEIWVATDIHYLSPKLSDYGEIFMQVMENGDSKMTEYSPQIVAEFKEKIIAAKPDALIVPGDITFNGELLSLEEMCGVFSEIESAGVPVLVIPGNHDIEYFAALSYSGTEYTPTEQITEEKFRELCSDFGIGEALSADESSFSYIYELGKGFRVLMIDSDTKGAYGKILDSTMDWIENQLEAAQKDGAKVIAVTHRNSIKHGGATFGNMILNADELTALFRKYGVADCFSGHIHTQHFAEEDGIREYVTESMAVLTFNYGIISVDGERNVSYDFEALGSEYEDAARERFCAHSAPRIESDLESSVLSGAQKAVLKDFLLELNMRAFSGTLTEEWLLEHGEETALCEKLGENSIYERLLNIYM